MYKQASQLKLRFQTSAGVLSVEQLWDLSFANLSNAIKVVSKQLNKTIDAELSFLDDTVVIDVENQLRFDILKDVYLEKKKIAEARKIAFDNKAHNEVIYAKMAANDMKAMDAMSNEELAKYLKH
jgi:hypothetical protein